MNCKVDVYMAGFTGNVTHYKWRIRNPAGKQVAVSGENYTSKGGCERAISILATMFEEGQIDGVPDWPTDTPKVQQLRQLDLVDT